MSVRCYVVLLSSVAFAAPWASPQAQGRTSIVRAVDVPIAVIGAADDTVDLSSAAHVIVLGDGRIATFDLRSQLHVFAANGKLQRRWGGVGVGPGQFLRAHGMQRWRGDTLVVADPGTRRITWIHPDRGRVRDQLCERCFPRQVHELLGVLADGRLVLGGLGIEGAPPSGQGIERSRARVAVVDLTTATAREVADLPDLEMLARETRFRGRRARDAVAVGFTPRAHAVVVGDRIITGEGTAYSFALRAGDGSVQRSFRFPTPARRPITSPMRAAHRASQRARLHGPRAEAPVDLAESERLIEVYPFADSLPAYSALRRGVGDRWWVVSFVAPGDNEWSAFELDTAGAAQRRATGRGPGIPIAFGRDRVVVRTEDADGVVQLRVHRLP